MKVTYLVLKNWRNEAGTLILKRGCELNRLYINNWLLYGLNENNHFWTDDFLDTKPDLFQRIETECEQ